MGRGRGRIAVVEDDMRQTYTVKHIRKGLTLLSYDGAIRFIDPIIGFKSPLLPRLEDALESEDVIPTLVNDLYHV